jgi:undecaprenyl-diphosphatase
MSLLHIIILAIIQGVTEFLPISSSGHLYLLPGLTGTEDQGVALDVAVHVGTLFAVIAYFWSDVKEIFIGTFQMLRGRVETRGARMAFHLMIATIPVVPFGLFLHVTGLNEAMRSVAVVGWTMLLFGLVLYWADKTGSARRTSEDWSWKHALYMGLAQALALIPGTSRSGITITAGRALGYGREEAARLAMLMSIPAILASGALLAGDAIAEADIELLKTAAIAASFAFAFALLALVLMMRLLRSISFTPYVIYRVVLGVVLLIYAYS